MRIPSLILFATGIGLGATLLRKTAIIQVTVHQDRSVHYHSVSQPPVTEKEKTEPAIVINNEKVDLPIHDFLLTFAVENEPQVEDFLRQITNLIDPYMGPERVETLKSNLRAAQNYFTILVRRQYAKLYKQGVNHDS